MTPTIARLPALIRSTLAQNVFSIYLGQAALWVVPFITVPYLARVLGVSEWGRYSLALSLSTQLALLIEYGFGIMASRNVARQRAEPGALGAILGAVVVAKMILVLLGCCLAAIEYARIPAFRQDGTMFWFSVSAGIAQGINFSWYLYGIEKIAAAVAIDLSSRVLGAMSLLLVSGPADAWKFFAVQTAANLLALVLGLRYVVRAHAISWPQPGAVTAMLRGGFTAMLSRSGFGMYTGLNTFVLGLYASSEVVGQYAGAERIARGISALSAPLCMAIFPRVNYLLAANPARLGRLRTVGGSVTVMLGGLASGAMYTFAPFVTRVVLGTGYGGSAGILRLLSPLPLLVAINQVLLYQYLFPDGAFDYIAASLAGTTVVLLLAAAALGWAGNASTIAAVANIAEVAATICLLLRVCRGRTRLVTAT